MNPNRDDFFTLIHKGLRRELFAVTTMAGSTDWTDQTAVAAVGDRWCELHHLLEIHPAHEDEHFFPLLEGRAPDVLASVESQHHELDATLTKLGEVIRGALTTPSEAGGLNVHRELSEFVGRYLLHLIDEETIVMPAIWQHCSDDEIGRARAAFLAAMPPDDASLSRAVMLPAMSPAERVQMFEIVRAAAPPPVFASMVEQAHQVLDDASWRRLSHDVSFA
jgi:hypothetical protein